MHVLFSINYYYLLLADKNEIFWVDFKTIKSTYLC